MFVTIVNEFEKVQGMINYRTLSQQKELSPYAFRMFRRMIEKGDHICKPSQFSHARRI